MDKKTKVSLTSAFIVNLFALRSEKKSKNTKRPSFGTGC